MPRGLCQAFGALTMMTMLMGMTGRVMAEPIAGFGGVCAADAVEPSQAPRARSIHDVIFQLLEASDGSAVVTAVSSEVTFKKIVYPDGRTEAAFERGRDRVSVVTTTAGVTISRGASTITIEHSGVTDEALGRVRTVWAASPALRAFRALAAAIEEDDDVKTPERLAVWLTGALVAQIDGDDSAVSRLAKRLRVHLNGPERTVRLAAVDCWSIYADAVVRAASRLERGHAALSIWDPRRQGCGFVWTLQVEDAWFGHLSCSSFPK